ncbi:aspartyl protease AED1-like [Miscanthus floridulus]|uniref:aspartyl protease AED1-like n=1 Tax=Miscanthus floridulus TaxID=154761 RepID=UPI0034593FE9
MYFIDLVGISLDDEDLPIRAGTFGRNASTNLAVETTFTMLAPDAYTPLHDSFQKKMSQYNNLSSPGFDGFDTCFNFTGLHELTLPLVEFKFSNGESLAIDVHQMLYYDDPAAVPFTMACLAFSARLGRRRCLLRRDWDVYIHWGPRK